MQQSRDDGLCDSAGAGVRTSGGNSGRRIRWISGAGWLERLSAVWEGRAPDLPGASAAPLSGDAGGSGKPRDAVSASGASPVAIVAGPAGPPRPGADQRARVGGGARSTGSMAGPGAPEAHALPGQPALEQPPLAGTQGRLYVPVLSWIRSHQLAEIGRAAG